jgi:DNA-binding IclR family transcriptional regulator
MGQSSGIGVLDKAVVLLETTARSPMGLAELVESTAMPRATVHRLAMALETHRLLVRDASGRWSPGPALREFADAAPDPLLAGAESLLTRLRDATAESAQLYRRSGHERTCIAAAERGHGLRDTVPVGARLPMTAGSAAQVLLAWSTPADIEEILAEASFNARTLAEVRRRGWAQSVAERESGVASVSAPVRDSAGRVVAAVSVSGPIERLGRRPGTHLARPVCATALALSGGLDNR